MFAPVYYPQPVYAQPNFVFTPSISIVGSAVTANLFVQASTNQYLFGNFYAQNFVSVGITPWFSFSFATGRPAYYDPLFSYYAVINVRQNPGWVAQIREQYAPAPRTCRAKARRAPSSNRRGLIERNVNITRNVTVVDHRTMAMPLSKMAADPVAGRGMRLVQSRRGRATAIHQQVAQLHQFREQRLQQEREGARARAAGGAAAARPRPMNLPHSPIAVAAAPRRLARERGSARPEEAPSGRYSRRGQPAAPRHVRQASRESETAEGREPRREHPKPVTAAANDQPPARSRTAPACPGEQNSSHRATRQPVAPASSPSVSASTARPRKKSVAGRLEAGRDSSRNTAPCSSRVTRSCTQRRQTRCLRFGIMRLSRQRGRERIEMGRMDRTGSAVEVGASTGGALRSGSRLVRRDVSQRADACASSSRGRRSRRASTSCSISPTGTGKTLAAFLAILDRLFRADADRGARTRLEVRLRFAPAQSELRHRTQFDVSARRNPPANRS